MADSRIAVIGAGMAGLSCAAALHQAGLAVVVFEKSRGLGGRIATRRRDERSFDHGAQYVTARGTRFENLLRRLSDAGAVAQWQPKGWKQDSKVHGGGVEQPWFIGTPGMSALVKPLANGLQIHRGTRVVELSHRSGGWYLRTETGEPAGPFDAVAVAVPAPQATTLLAGHGDAFARIQRAIMAPCWAAMMTFEKPIKAAADVLRPADGPITWAARNNAKPGRDGKPEAWVVHAGPDWSREHLEQDAADMAEMLWQGFRDLLGGRPAKPAFLSAHRWRFALCETPLQTPCLIGEDGTLGAAGDWCLGARVEAAFDSGWALGTRLAARFGGR